MQYDGIKWSPHVLVEKYSDDQVGWARRKSGIAEPRGALLRALTGEPALMPARAR